MILVCGIPSEAPVARLLAQLQADRIPHTVFNQRDAEHCDVELHVDGGRITGELRIDGTTLRLEDVTGVYTRLMDPDQLPELAGEPETSPRRQHVRDLHAILTEWHDATAARVVNRTSAMASNFSKPFQAQAILQAGFLTPETLVTDDPELVLEFRRGHERVIYKSISGSRSIVTELSDGDTQRLDHLRHCPVQFQELVRGIDVRVHTIGGNVFATAVSSDAVDYRYAHTTNGREAQLDAVELSDELGARCVALARSLRLEMAGIDLRLTGGGDVYCFEVNPSPAYSYYEANTGQPMARALAAHLAGRDAP